MHAGLCAEAEPEQHPRRGQPKGERRPDTHQSPVQHEGKQVAHRQGDDEVGDEGHQHHRPDVGYSTQGIGKGYLEAVTELIDQEGQE